MKPLLILSIAFLLSACTPPASTPDGLDGATDAAQATDAGPEAASDALPPHTDGGGID